MFEVGTKAFVIKKQIAQVGKVATATHKGLTGESVSITLNRCEQGVGLLKQTQQPPGILELNMP